MCKYKNSNFDRSSLHVTREYDARQPAHHVQCVDCGGEKKPHDSCDCHQSHSCDHLCLRCTSEFMVSLSLILFPHNLANRLDHKAVVWHGGFHLSFLFLKFVELLKSLSVPHTATNNDHGNSLPLTMTHGTNHLTKIS